MAEGRVNRGYVRIIHYRYTIAFGCRQSYLILDTMKFKRKRRWIRLIVFYVKTEF